MLDTPARDYIYNPSLQKCWNVDDCGENIIQFDCVTSGGTCAGASSYANMQFVINPDQTMSSYVHVNQCVYIRSDDSLWLDDCDSSSPKWTYQSNGLVRWCSRTDVPEPCFFIPFLLSFCCVR